MDFREPLYRSHIVRTRLIELYVQYLVLTLGDAKEATSVINKTLNPEWNQTLDLPISGVQSLLLEACCWDKDRFGKDYMGEFDVVLEDVFQNGNSGQEVCWHPMLQKVGVH